jgi:hypothetical protein
MKWNKREGWTFKSKNTDFNTNFSPDDKKIAKDYPYYTGNEPQFAGLGPNKLASKVAKANKKQSENRQKAANNLNAQNLTRNEKHSAFNKYQQASINRFQSSTGGDYVNKRDGINTEMLTQAGFTEKEINELQDNAKSEFKNFYKKEKIVPWDAAAFGKQPKNGTFDAEYYLKNSDPSLLEKWKAAQDNDDLDLLNVYGDVGTYAQWSYTSTGKSEGRPGNEESIKELTAVTGYEEITTDEQMGRIRDEMLGYTPGEDEEEDMVDSDSFLGKVLDSETLKEDIAGQQKFYALQQDVLQRVNKAQKDMQDYAAERDLYAGFPEFSDYMNANQNLTNEILDGLGGGGMMGIGGMKSGIENLIGNVTGISSNAMVYDWQKFFDEELATKYEDMDTITSEEYGELELDQEFRDDFINEYLKPRFDGSKSMSEFTSYMDVRKGEENIYQTRTTVDAIREVVAKETKAFMDQLKERNNSPRDFDPEFYFNPEGDKGIYATQREQVSANWERAKENPDKMVGETGKTWQQWAYFHGMDLNNKNDFAKLHYQVKGKTEGFDGAKDLLTQNDVRNFITEKIVPAVAEIKIEAGEAAFLPFDTPDTFIDEYLGGANPFDDDSWKSAMKDLGYDDDDLDELTSLDEVKDIIKETLGSSEGAEMRARIKELNEKKKKLDQTTLGLDYIVRESDKEDIDEDTNDFLYEQYKNSGYEGTRDEFYEDFFPDDPDASGEMAELGKYMSGEGFNLDMSDPFAALGSVGKLMGDEQAGGNIFSMGDEMPGDNTSEYESAFSFSTDRDDAFEGYRSQSGSDLIGQFSMFG